MSDILAVLEQSTPTGGLRLLTFIRDEETGARSVEMIREFRPFVTGAFIIDQLRREMPGLMDHEIRIEEDFVGLEELWASQVARQTEERRAGYVLELADRRADLIRIQADIEWLEKELAK